MAIKTTLPGNIIIANYPQGAPALNQYNYHDFITVQVAVNILM